MSNELSPAMRQIKMDEYAFKAQFRAGKFMETVNGFVYKLKNKPEPDSDGKVRRFKWIIRDVCGDPLESGEEDCQETAQEIMRESTHSWYHMLRELKDVADNVRRSKSSDAAMLEMFA